MILRFHNLNLNYYNLIDWLSLILFLDSFLWGFGVLVFFSNEENAWIVSAVLLGLGSGIFFWKD